MVLKRSYSPLILPHNEKKTFHKSAQKFSVVLLFPLSVTIMFKDGFWCLVKSKIDKVLSINTFANIFVLEHLSVHHKDWLTYSDGTENIVKEPYSDGQVSCSNPWFLQPCSFECFSSFWPQYFFCSSFPSIVKLWSCCCLKHVIYLQTQSEMSLFIIQPMIIFVWIKIVFSVIWEMFRVSISLNLVLQQHCWI